LRNLITINIIFLIAWIFFLYSWYQFRRWTNIKFL
jgi:hypothetical protein